MDIFIFTYAKDACMLPQSVAAAARHGRVVLVDQADAPACAGEAEAKALGAAEYVRTEWPRGGNLNGVEAVRGMLDTYMAHGTDEWVMQLDSDMLLLDGAGLLGDAHADMYGQTIGWDDDKALRRAVQYCAGGGMLIRRTMLEPMRKLMADGVLGGKDMVAYLSGGRARTSFLEINQVDDALNHEKDYVLPNSNRYL